MAVKSFKRVKRLFDPHSEKPFRLSRTRLENFLSCPRCFYLDRRLGVEPPGMPSFTLNSAVDTLLKKEFDGYRRQGKIHPIMEAYNIKALPFVHHLLDEWRENFKGVAYHHQATNLIIFGAVDDLWVDDNGELIVVDYKATCSEGKVTLDGVYRQAYKRQMEIYQWLLRKQSLKVSNTGYFLYCNGDKSKAVFDGRLEFATELIAYQGNDSWVEGAVIAAHKCLMSDQMPNYSDECPYCCYRREARLLENGPIKAIQVEIQGELF